MIERVKVAGSAVSALSNPSPGKSGNSGPKLRVCPECGVKFPVPIGRGSHKAFCSPAHKVAFANRCAARGKVLVPYAMAWRTGRPGGGQKSSPIVKDAFAEMNRTIDRWAEEDRKAGRPKLVDYVGGIMATGFTSADRAGNFGSRPRKG